MFIVVVKICALAATFNLIRCALADAIYAQLVLTAGVVTCSAVFFVCIGINTRLATYGKAHALAQSVFI
jgi:hypothetical protein